SADCAMTCSRLGTSATSASSPTAPNTARGLRRPRWIACFSQDQPATGLLAWVDMALRARAAVKTDRHRTRQARGSGLGRELFSSPRPGCRVRTPGPVVVAAAALVAAAPAANVRLIPA